MRPFVRDDVILWAWATWWIPLLAIFGVWRHVVRRYPLVYAPMYWSLVFPLGMTRSPPPTPLASDFHPIEIFSQAMVWIALGAWVATMLGLLASARAHLRAARLVTE